MLVTAGSAFVRQELLMRRFGKILAFVLTAALFAGLFAGCGAGDNHPEDDRITITIWTIATEGDAFHKPFTEAIAEYNRSQDKYKVVMETFENDQYKAKLPIQVKANQLPDIFYTWAGGFSEAFVASGKVLELDSFYEKYRDELPESKLAARYDGKLYGIPYVTPISVVFYNKKAFAEAGIESTPETYDEWLACCEKLKEAGIIPIGNAAKSDNAWVLAMLYDALMLKTVGPGKLAKVLTDKEGSYNSTAFLEGTEAFRKIISLGYMDPRAGMINNDQALEKLYRGESAMYVTGSWLACQFYDPKNCENPEDFDFFPVPVINEANASATDFMGGSADTLMVNRYSEHPEEAAEIAFLLARSVSRRSYLSGAGTPAWNVDYDTSAVLPLPKKIAETCEGATSFTLWFDTLMVADDKDEYLKNLTDLYNGTIDAQQFVRNMAEKLSQQR